MTMPGPAFAAAAWPVSTKMPVPMIAPMPSAMRFIGPRTRRSPCVPAADSRRAEMGFVRNSDMAGSLSAPANRDLFPDLRHGRRCAEGDARTYEPHAQPIVQPVRVFDGGE